MLSAFLAKSLCFFLFFVLSYREKPSLKLVSTKFWPLRTLEKKGERQMEKERFYIVISDCLHYLVIDRLWINKYRIPMIFNIYACYYPTILDYSWTIWLTFLCNALKFKIIFIAIIFHLYCQQFNLMHWYLSYFRFYSILTYIVEILFRTLLTYMVEVLTFSNYLNILNQLVSRAIFKQVYTRF